jgi:hypothetical protein
MMKTGNKISVAHPINPQNHFSIFSLPFFVPQMGLPRPIDLQLLTQTLSCYEINLFQSIETFLLLLTFLSLSLLPSLPLHIVIIIQYLLLCFECEFGSKSQRTYQLSKGESKHTNFCCINVVHVFHFQLFT